MALGSESRRPRSSAEVVRSSIDEVRSKQRRHSLFRLLLTAGLIAVIVWGANVVLIGDPLKAALDADAHTRGMPLVGHLAYYVDPTTLVLDLRQPVALDTVYLFRAVLAAEHQLLLPDVVKRVVFRRMGTSVYELSGADYRRLGGLVAEGRNPIVVLRDLPAVLRLPDGTTAQVADADDAARHWASGAP